MPVKNVKVSIGQLLLAEPFLADPYFRRAVILLCENNNMGSIGFIMNKRINVMVTELMADFPYFEAEVFYGGPVQTDTLHYVHRLGEKLEGSILVSPGVWWGGDFQKLKDLIAEGEVALDDIRFMVGYAGWGASQLNTEMEFGTWIIADMHPDYVFKFKPENLWRRVMFNKGDQFEVLADMKDEPIWN